ncbi:MAG: hypothetical protein AMXMBFR84_44330 [Candidatus Hydrogenedentota bacterium]
MRRIDVQSVRLTCAMWATIVGCLVGNAALAQQASIAVLEFNNKAGIDKGVGSAISDMLTTNIVKTRKFDVVERVELKKVVSEQALGDSGAVDAATAAKIGKLKGADYILVGVVTEAGQTSRDYSTNGFGGALPIPGMGSGLMPNRVQRQTISLGVDIRFVDTTTGDVVFAEDFVETRKSTGVGTDLISFDPNNPTEGEMARSLVHQLTKRVLLIVYPPKIAKLGSDNKTVTLNYGDVMFTPGEVWMISSQGEEVKDPDSGQSLGFEEVEVGRVKITDTQSAMTIAEVIDGAEKLAVGQICSPTETKRVARKSSAKSEGNSGGGIVDKPKEIWGEMKHRWENRKKGNKSDG